MHNSQLESSNRSDGNQSSLMAWLKLLRLPTVFTSVSNVACGYFVTANTRQFFEIAGRPEFWLLIVSSSCLYLGGMVLNDAFDSELDLVERPERPIPSGLVGKTSAFFLGYFLVGSGIFSAWWAAGNTSLMIAIGIACGVILYDSVLKNTVVAPLGMAACRFLNLLLGCSAAFPLPQIFTPDNPGLPLAVGLCVYVFGVTLFAMNEAGSISTKGLVAGMILAVLGVAIHLVTATRMYQTTQSSAAVGCLLMLGVLLANFLLRVGNAIQLRQSRQLQKTVGFMLLNIIFFDAAMTFCLTGSAQLAACISILVIPATLLKKLLPLS